MKPVVLAVDDEASILRAIKRLLRRDDYEVITAEGGQAALEIVKERDVAVIVCDQRMPGMTGAQTLSAVYDMSPDTYRITLTGYTDLDAAQASINEGHINLFLVKPWNDDRLRAAVADGVRSHQLIVENRQLQELTRQQNEKLEAWNKELEQQVAERTAALKQKNEQLEELSKNLESSLRDAVVVLASTLGAYDPSLGVHSGRVAKFATQIAGRMGVRGDELRDIIFASYLHDLGKIANVGNDRKGPRRAKAPGKPTPVSESGYNILSRVAGFRQVALVIRHQNEMFDGKGQPSSLKGEGIPLGARIIAIANAFDSAVYSSANPTQLDVDKGIKVLKKGAGSQFDPNIVKLVTDKNEDKVIEIDDCEVEIIASQLKPGMVLARDIHKADGVLLLKQHTKLTPALIDRIRLLSQGELILRGVFVRSALAVAEKEEEVDGDDDQSSGEEAEPTAA